MPLNILKPSTNTHWDEIRGICLATGAADAELWIGPYQRKCPEWTWIALNDSGAVMGYITGCTDTESFGAPASHGPKFIDAEYPAHLHVNVSPSFQKQGVGEALIKKLLNALQKKNIPGIHLWCGPAPRKFYEKLGFELREERETKPGKTAYLLVKRLAKRS